MLDTRREVRRQISKLEFNSQRSLFKVFVSLLIAGIVALFPEYPGLSDAGQWTLFIMLFGASLWISEAIPAFATALVIIALEIAILGRPNGVFAVGPKDWEIFVRPWSSPLIWLFFGGFILAAAASKTRLDRWLARNILGWFGSKPSNVLIGLMLISFVFSMFMSNTATTAMMLAVLAPVLATLDKKEPFAKAMLLGVPFAANLGGMGTIIGSPPNAIAVGSLTGDMSINFAQWMMIGLPPAIVLGIVIWFYLVKKYRAATMKIDLSDLMDDSYKSATLPLWKKLMVMFVFILTVALWLTGPLHGIPTPVVSFIPITIFASVRVIGVEELRKLPWEVLILLTGGLSLGVAVSQTGLAEWMVSELSLEQSGMIIMAFAFSYFASIISNFMSNTAATNILVPIGLAAAVGFEPQVIIAIALGASSAMCMPISTPPNALAYSSGKLEITDFLQGGILVGIIAPIISVSWIIWVFDKI
jgi:solute carrier family 13 (sodium-dependent dicarboxylate transporter), member 2/3/5